jgi:hypothetical protein
MQYESRLKTGHLISIWTKNKNSILKGRDERAKEGRI